MAAYRVAGMERRFHREASLEAFLAAPVAWGAFLGLLEASEGASLAEEADHPSGGAAFHHQEMFLGLVNTAGCSGYRSVPHRLPPRTEPLMPRSGSPRRIESRQSQP